MLFTSDELEQVISKLNSLLMEGHLIKISLSNGYSDIRKRDKPIIDAWMTEQNNKVNEWYRKTGNELDSIFHSNSHYLFHFLNGSSKRSALTIVGVPMELSNLIMILEAYLISLEDIIIRLEEKENLQIRKEIAEQEQGADVLYKITYSEHTRQIKLNNIVLTKTDFNSENDNAFQHIYLNANKTVNVEEIEKAVGNKLHKRLSDIVRDLGFTGNLRVIFFPAVTKTELMFINPITKQYALKNELPFIDFSKVGRQMETQGDKK